MNPGTQAMPLKTISRAQAVPGPGKRIKVAPGVYDAALGGEIPVFIQAGHELIGDVANKGDGMTPIRDSGGAVS